MAADVPLPIDFVGTTSVTIEYGQIWYFDLESDPNFVWALYQPGHASVTATGGVPASFDPDFFMYTTSGPLWAGKGFVSSSYEQAPLGVGSYDITVSGSHDDGSDVYHGETAPPAHVTVTKAPLGIDLRVLADPSHPEAAIVTAKFTGRYVDEYVSSSFLYGGMSPAGKWTITLKDADGEVVIERSFDRAAGDDRLATSFYWTAGEPDAEYTASATFAPSGSSGANFAVTPSNDFSYTVPAAVRPTPSSTAPAEAPGALPEASEFSLPVWVLVLAGVLIVGLGVLVALLGLRLRKPAAAITGAVAS